MPLFLAEGDFNWFGPVVVFVIWIVSRFLQNKASENQPDPDAAPQNDSSTPAPPALDPAEEQMRRIREEIRRKIAERRHQTEGAGEQPPHAPTPAPAAPMSPPLSAPRPVADGLPRFPTWPTPKPATPHGPATPPTDGPRESSFPTSQGPAFPPRPAVTYEEKINRQLTKERDLESARTRQSVVERSERAAAAMHSGTEINSANTSETGRVAPLKAHPLVESLHNSNEVRRAILMAEILGRPVSLRPTQRWPVDSPL